jgi:hypothetical protein
MANRLALIAAAVFAAGCTTPVAYAEAVKCRGTSACKGQSSCTASRDKGGYAGKTQSKDSMASKNSCRGKGVPETGPAECVPSSDKK